MDPLEYLPDLQPIHELLPVKITAPHQYKQIHETIDRNRIHVHYLCFLHLTNNLSQTQINFKQMLIVLWHLKIDDKGIQFCITIYTNYEGCTKKMNNDFK